MTDHYQFKDPDGDWTPGKERFEDMWGFARDRLRFHRGAGFTLRVNNVTSEKRTLSQASDRTRAQLDDNDEDTVVLVKSMKDGFGMEFRRHQVSKDKGELVVAEAASRRGIPYHFGVTDCSWLTKDCISDVTDGRVELPHNAHAQHLLTSVVKPIRKEDLKPGDLVFIHEDDHVAIWVGNLPGYPGGPVVWDTEPSDTTAPGGWPKERLGTGVQLRPAYAPWYCGFPNAWGRIEAINGAP